MRERDLYEHELRSFFTHGTRMSGLLSGRLETNPFAMTMGRRQYGPSRRSIHCAMARATEPQRLTHRLRVATHAHSFTCGPKDDGKIYKIIYTRTLLPGTNGIRIRQCNAAIMPVHRQQDVYGVFLFLFFTPNECTLCWLVHCAVSS